MALPASGSVAFATLLQYGDKRREKCVVTRETTANRMELQALIEGLRQLKEPCKVKILTDAIYPVRGINDWLERWQKREFQKVKNLDLWQDYLSVAEQHEIEITLAKDYIAYPELAHCNAVAHRELEKSH